MQTRVMSIIEMLTGKALGFMVGLSVQILILPLYFNASIPMKQYLELQLIFMLAAAVKSYGVRRFFNWWQWGRT